MPSRLTKISLKGFKTYADMDGENAFEPRQLNVLVGPNGAGKSNLIAFFRMLNWAMSGKLQEYLARVGGASNILCDGPSNTRELVAHLTLETEQGENEYQFVLNYAADDTLICMDERYRFSKFEFDTPHKWNEVKPVGKRELQLPVMNEQGDTTARVMLTLLKKVNVYQFHDTSDTARIRGKWGADDGRYLREDDGNLAAVLLRLREKEPSHYHRIAETLRTILPFFHDFELTPEYNAVLLRWTEKHTDQVFTASQAADGMLRIMALVTLLLLPRQNLPHVLILDEPELGLHPFAIEVVGGLIRSLAQHVQIFVATQSVPLIDCFEPEDIVVVDRGYNGSNASTAGRYSRLRRLDRAQLGEWLEEYSLSELWEKNVFGGRP